MMPDGTNGPVRLLLDTILPEEAQDRIRALSSRIELLRETSEETLARAQVIYTSRAAFDPAAAPELRWVQIDSAAVNHILPKPVAKLGIPVANVRGAYSAAVAELAIALLLGLMRRFGPVHAMQLERAWPKDYSSLRGEECYGKTMGILGYGSIGRQVGRLAHAMGMTVLAAKRHPERRRDDGFSKAGTGDPEGSIPASWYGMDNVAEMFAACDVVTITAPLTAETQRLVGRRELARLKSSTYIVNVARGAIVDEVALADCLAAGRLAGAGLDVFAVEPLDSGSPLWSLPNVLITPHLGSYTHRQRYLAAEIRTENLARYLEGRPLINLVDLQRGY